MSLFSFCAVKKFAPVGLSRVISATPTRSGVSGSIMVLAHHYNDVLGQWCNLDGIPGALSPLGFAVTGVPLVFPTFACRANEQVELVAGYKRIDATTPASKLISVSFAFETLTTAPEAPTVRIVSASDDLDAGFVVDFTLPSGAFVTEVQVKSNGGAWGATSGVFAPETRICFSGYTAGDIVQAQARTVNAVGLASAWVATLEATVGAGAYVPILQDSWTEAWDVPSNQWGAQW